MNENLGPNGQEEKDKKKAAAPWLPASANTAKRGQWGSMFAKTGPVGRLMATKAGMLGLALGVTALASIAGVMIAKNEPAKIPAAGSQFASRAASKYYTPSGARNKANQSSLSLITGNKDYSDAVASASSEPEAAVEETAAYAPEMPALPEAASAKKGAKFSSSGASPSTGGGSSSAAVVSNSGTKAKQEEKKTSALPDAFNSAKAGAGMRSTGLGGRSPSRAAGNATGRRQATGASKGQSSAAPGGAEFLGGLEARKAAADAKFNEGNSKVGNLLGSGASGASNTGDTSSAQMPEAPSDTSSGSAAAGGGGGGGSDAEACISAAEKLKSASEIMRKGVGSLAKLVASGTSDDAGRDALCNIDDNGTAKGAIDNVNGGLKNMKTALDDMSAEQCDSTDIVNGWECGVMCNVEKDVSAALTEINTLCLPYYTYRTLDNRADELGDLKDERKKMQQDYDLNQYKTKKDEYDKLKEDFASSQAISKLTSLDTKLADTEESDTDGMAEMAKNYSTCDYDTQDQNVGDFTGGQMSHNCEPNEFACSQAAFGSASGWQGWNEFWSSAHAWWDSIWDGNSRSVEEIQEDWYQTCLTNHANKCEVEEPTNTGTGTATNTSADTSTETSESDLTSEEQAKVDEVAELAESVEACGSSSMCSGAAQQLASAKAELQAMYAAAGTELSSCRRSNYNNQCSGIASRRVAMENAYVAAGGNESDLYASDRDWTQDYARSQCYSSCGFSCSICESY